MTPGELLNPLPQAVLRLIASQLSCLRNEVLLVIFLDKAGAFLGDELIAGGTPASHGVSYRRLFERAFTRGAARLLLAHNHPSGCAAPSDTDVLATRELQALAIPMEMQLVDHLIVSAGQVFSMRAAGLLA